VADIAIILVVSHVEGRQVARCRDVATRCGGSATHRHSLSTSHNGARVLLEEDAAIQTELLLVWLISEGLEIVLGLLVGEEEEQAQEFTVDAAYVPEVDIHAGKKATWRLRR
jgi:hypothetical protein